MLLIIIIAYSLSKTKRVAIIVHLQRNKKQNLSNNALGKFVCSTFKECYDNSNIMKCISLRWTTNDFCLKHRISSLYDSFTGMHKGIPYIVIKKGGELFVQ